MSNWLSKLFTVSKNSVNDVGENLVDSLIDIRREGTAIVKKLESNIDTLKGRLEDAQADVVLKKNSIVELKNKSSIMESVAEKAVKVGNDVDAKQALTRIESYEKTIQAYQTAVDMLQPIIDAQLVHLQDMHTEKVLLQAEIEILDIEEKAMKGKSDLLSGKSSGFGSSIDIDMLRKRVDKAKATVEAKEIISEKTGDSLEKKYSGSTSNQNVDDKLAKLKEKLSGDKAIESKVKVSFENY